MYDHEKILLGILVALLSLIGVLVWLGVLAEDAKIDGCRDAGGAMVGEICIIRSDCMNSVERERLHST